MGSSSVWGNIRGFTVMEYVRSRDSGIFRRWWAKVVSPYNIVLGILILNFLNKLRYTNIVLAVNNLNRLLAL